MSRRYSRCGSEVQVHSPCPARPCMVWVGYTAAWRSASMMCLAVNGQLVTVSVSHERVRVGARCGLAIKGIFLLFTAVRVRVLSVLRSNKPQPFRRLPRKKKMAPRAEPLPAPIPLAEAHRGWNTDGDDDDDHRYYRPTTSVTGTNAADLAGFPTDAALISNGDGGGNSIHPVAIILPVLAGAALLLLAVGGFMIWRRRKRAAGARQSETSTEMSSRTSAAASESVQNLRGGDGGVLYAEKVRPLILDVDDCGC